MGTNTTIRLHNHCSLYYGKIPQRGDFIKSTSGGRVIPLIDHWVARGMELLIEDPNWKNLFDSAGVADFLFLGTQKKHAICGALTPSGDSSSRRFPFIAATVFEIDNPIVFLPLSPFVLDRHINQQRALALQASKSHDATSTLAALEEIPLETEHSQEAISNLYQHFLENTSIADLRKALVSVDEETTVRQMVLAIGFLLLPALTNYRIPPQKGLILPLPRDPVLRTQIKAFWLDLISIFISRTEFELSIFAAPYLGQPRLSVAFNGATPISFCNLFQGQSAKNHLIDVCQSRWVEDHAVDDPATFKLSSYLRHEDLPLKQLVDTFRQAFSG